MTNLNHLTESNENYFQHGIRALKIAIILFSLCFLAMLHAFIPIIFCNRVSSGVKSLNKEIQTGFIK